MRSFVRITPLLAVALAFGGCVGSDMPTDTTPPASHYGWVEGRVYSLSNKGVPLANVFIHIPATRNPGAYAATSAQTTFTGDYRVVVYRTGDVGELPPSDTVTVWVLARQNNPQGGRVDSASIQMKFFPAEQTSVPQQLNLTLAVP